MARLWASHSPLRRKNRPSARPHSADLSLPRGRRTYADRPSLSSFEPTADSEVRRVRRSPLQPEQEELLAVMVEATRSVPQSERHPFLIIAGIGSTVLAHGGLAAIGKTNFSAYVGDAETLNSRGLIRLKGIDRHTFEADITPEGVEYYEEMKQRGGQPANRVTQEVREYVSTGEFRGRHPNSYSKWEQAEARLWSTDSNLQLTTIGHLCREAMQEFATELIHRYNPPNADSNQQNTVNRVRVVIAAQSMSDTVQKLSDALIGYWGALSDLVQRQEHGAQKEGIALGWEDARRVVFQTLLVMYELDRALR
jgi:hypothetical protein